MLLAVERGRPVGFATGVEITRPDRGTELLLYELVVDPPARRRGIGRALVRALRDLAAAEGCGVGTWVATEADNAAALATYADGEADREDGIVVFTWPG